MDTTKPAANFQPHSVQYTPIDRSIESSVLALVSPSTSSLAFVITKSRADLNFASNRPSKPRPPAAPLPRREPRFAPAGWQATAPLKPASPPASSQRRPRSGGTDTTARRPAASPALGSPGGV